MNEEELTSVTASESARALSVLGAAKGGKTRAARLSPERRQEIARNAVRSRWAKQGRLKAEDPNVAKAISGAADRPLRIGGIEIPCYVLEDERRVLVQSGMIDALSISHGGSGSKGGDRLTKFSHQERLKSFLDNDILARTQTPIYFRTTSGTLAYGYEAEVLAKLCFAVLDAQKNGKLMKQQEHIARQCEILVRGFAIVGINALVDEATGYQELRPKDALQRILKKYISGVLLEYARTFPLEFYKQMFRLKGWNWTGTKMSPLVGKYTKDLVYQRLAPGVLAELERLNPKNEKGQRRHKHFQWLTKDFGNPALNNHLRELIGMMRMAASWDQFYHAVDRDFPRVNSTLLLPLGD
jgi:hypothetical protein